MTAYLPPKQSIYFRHFEFKVCFQRISFPMEHYLPLDLRSNVELKETTFDGLFHLDRTTLDAMLALLPPVLYLPIGTCAVAPRDEKLLEWLNDSITAVRCSEFSEVVLPGGSSPGLSTIR
jgi:hypothetical protein